MITHNFNTLDLLTSPVWIVSPFEEQLIYANSAARLLMQDLTFSQLRTGPYSVSSQKELPKYLSDLQNQHDIIEILTVQRKEEETALSCRLVLRELTETEPVIIFEGIEAPATLGLKASRSANYQRKKQGFYARFFLTNSAPMLLIDPSRDGQIVDANLAALNFYGYNHETMCQKHTWEINMLGRRVMPIMHEISHLPGGHKPLNFVHKLADGSTRHVQTYAGPIEIYGDKLMLCIVHDITEQKRLEEQLEHAAHHDAMTGLLNRRQFYHITEPGQMQHLAIAQDYSLLLIDTDRFKHINDLYGHSKGDEVLCALARTLESCARKGDLVFRWGGEEFVLLLPRTPLDTALSLAETIRVSVAKVSISGLPRFTVSIGVAHHEGNESIDELFKRVDDATLALHAIAPHSEGASRVNVGVMQAGSGRNVVPASALLKVETRGASDVINQYVFDRAQQAIQGAATMYGVGVETRLMGAATASSPSPQWVAWLQSQAAQVAGVNQAIERVEAPAGSEDATLMMARVQQHQGQASYVVFGTQLAAGHHNEKFDFDEQVLAIAVETLARTALNFPWTRGI
ncbi:M20/M25/M40 family metallo-hydrolase [Escherichia coli]|nr:M20/M25/M40 family metallo-hydrolase [Escherichia coli]EGJ4500238.1 M20/M25/M40 family metallo-hydrolase [Escherichia coli]